MLTSESVVSYLVGCFPHDGHDPFRPPLAALFNRRLQLGRTKSDKLCTGWAKRERTAGSRLQSARTTAQALDKYRILRFCVLLDFPSICITQTRAIAQVDSHAERMGAWTQVGSWNLRDSQGLTA